MYGRRQDTWRYRPAVGALLLVVGLVWTSLILVHGAAVDYADRGHRDPQLAASRTGSLVDPGLPRNPIRPGIGVTQPARQDNPPTPAGTVAINPGGHGNPAPPIRGPRSPGGGATLPSHSLRAWVTGYDLLGVTADGGSAGPGSCAVDPSVIPLGTTITIEGYGRCVADDTGSAVSGAALDIWVPDAQAAYRLTGLYTIHW